MWSIILLSVLVFLVWLLSGPSSPVYGIYYQPGKWYRIKYALFYLLVKLRQRQSRNAKEVSGQNAGYGMRSRSDIAAMDMMQQLPKEHANAVDAVYFNGASSNGCWFVGATARRHNDLVQTLLYIKIKGLGLLEMPTLPDTCLKSTSSETYAAGGLVIERIDPMKHWTLSYDGAMRLLREEGTEEEVKVSFTLNWHAYTKHFDFDTDLDHEALCDAIAREPWSRQRFDNLKLAHQTHYEQFGRITGTVHVANVIDYELDVRGVRDHSYGNVRDWRDFHRYAIQYLYLKDGRSICVGSICMPKTMSRLIIGYVMYPDSERVDTVTSTDLNLYEMGESGDDPTDFEIRFNAGNKSHHLKGHVIARPIFYMGYEWEAKIVERMCEFEVDGVKGWGISEWCYRNHTGRPEKYAKKSID